MKRSGVAILAVVAALGMLGGGLFALRPYLLRETAVLRSELPDAPQTAAFARGVRLALEDHGFRAGAFSVEHANHPPGGREPWGPLHVTFPPSAPPRLFRFSGRSEEYFRRRTTDRREGALAAAWALRQGVTSAHVVTDRTLVEGVRITFPSGPTEWSDQPERFLPVSDFVHASKKAELSLVSSEVAARDAEHRELVSQVAYWKMALVYIDAEGEGARLVRALRAGGYEGRILLSSRSVADDFLQAAGPAADGVFSTWAIEPRPPATFEAKHRERFGVAADPNSYRGYLDAHSCIEAIAKSGARTASDVRRALWDIPWSIPRDRFAVYVCRDGGFDLVEVLP